MPLTNRPGSAAADGGVSSRVQVPADGAASFAFFEMKPRPVVVAAHSVPVSLGVRARAATKPPARVPYAAAVRSVAPAGPIRTKSPQFGSVPEVVNSGQLASRKAWLPAQSRVRQTLWEPWKIVPALTGSAMIGA